MTITFSSFEATTYFYDVSFQVRADRIDVSGHALPRHSGTSTPCSGSRNALDTQENAQTSKTCMMAGIALRESRPLPRPASQHTTTDARMHLVSLRFCQSKEASDRLPLMCVPSRGAHIECHAVDHRAICACRPQLPALPFPHIPPRAGKFPSASFMGIKQGFHFSTSRGPASGALYIWTWKGNPNGSCSVSARLRLSSAVFYSHSGYGITDNASVDDTSSSSTSSSLDSGLLPVYR